MINPWFGLRSYPEGARIFGRDKEIVELSQKILYNTQTVIYGKSGIGKSSILNAGVFPILRRENYFPVYIRLVHDGMVSYTAQIMTTVLESLKRLRVEDLGAPEDSMYKDVEGYTKIRSERYDTSVEEGLWEFFHRHEFFYRLDGHCEEQAVAPVLIFDQFEEIFTLQKDFSKTDAFFNELASLLNNICPKHLLQDTVEVSERKTEGSSTGSLIKKGIVRKTTKLDYLEDTNMRLVLSLREDYLSYLERNIANIPSLKHNRYCLRPLSEEQAADIITKPIPGMIDLEVAKSIICKVTGSRPNNFEVGDDKSDIEVDSAILSLFLTELYKKKPADEPRMTMEMVDSLGANIISDFYKSSIAHIPEASIHFMEDNLITEGGRRDNIPLSKALTGISKKDLDYLESERLVHEFPWNGEMRVEFMHDILCDTISKARDERIERIRIERKDAALRTMRRRNRITVFGIFLLMLCISAYYFCFLFPVSEKYASTTKVWGEYKGVGHLTSKEALHLPYHFVLKKKGLVSKVYSSMECRDGFGAYSTAHSISPYLMPEGITDAGTIADGAAEKMESVCQWAFVRDLKNKKIIQERAYNDKHELVYACNYSTVTVSQDKASASSKKRSDTASVRSRKTSVETVVIGSYVDEQGLPLELLKSGFCFARITYNDAGHDKLIEYFDWEGNPALNSDGVYQAYFEYNDMGLVTSMSSLNKYGKRMAGIAGNCGMNYRYDGTRRIEELSIDEFGREKTLKAGYSKISFQYDGNGRETEMRFWNMGNPACPEGLFHKRIKKYEGNRISTILYDADDNILHRESTEYNVLGQKIAFEAEDSKGIAAVFNEYDEKGNLSYSEAITVAGTDTIGVYIYDKEGNREMKRFEGDIYADNYICYTTYDKQGRIITEAYYQLDGITPYEDDYRWHYTERTYIEKGKDHKSIWTEIVDSTCYYSESGLSHIEVNVRYPARKTGKYKFYEAHGPNITLKHSESRHYDAYGNPIEVIRDDMADVKTYSYVNAKTKELDGSSLTLTRYGFPTADFHDACLDEDGNLTEDPEFSLPSIYSGSKDRKAVFIEIIDKGRNFYGVLLESDSGVCYGADNYDMENFGYMDKVVYLNLTTMKVEETPLYTWERYWTHFNCNITEEEHQLYMEHYQRYLDGRSLQQ